MVTMSTQQQQQSKEIHSKEQMRIWIFNAKDFGIKAETEIIIQAWKMPISLSYSLRVT